MALGMASRCTSVGSMTPISFSLICIRASSNLSRAQVVVSLQSKCTMDRRASRAEIVHQSH